MCICYYMRFDVVFIVIEFLGDALVVEGLEMVVECSDVVDFS